MFNAALEMHGLIAAYENPQRDNIPDVEVSGMT